MPLDVVARVRHVTALPRLVASLLVGAIVGVVLGGIDRTDGALAGIAVTASFFTLWGWWAVWPLDADEMRRRAREESLTPFVGEVAVVIAAVGGLIGTSVLLIAGSHGRDHTSVLALVVVVMSWAGLHLMYAMRYAALHYADNAGALDFPGEHPPSARDFLYFSYTIGMTYAASDTDVTSTGARMVVLRHSAVSYLFGAAILANAINVVVGALAR